ncbi:MAG: GNAT family N-acetyltransferase [Paludibacteraceae bacterium]
MFTLREIHTSDAAYSWLERLWLDSFPRNERRDTDAQRYNTDMRTNFHCLLAEDDGKAVGFITYWHFGDFCYGEHLATDPSCRNKGYGAKILSALDNHLLTLNTQRSTFNSQHTTLSSQRSTLNVPLPFVLEVEMPTDELSRRRIAFYERNGFALWRDCAYQQPPYRPEDTPLPMLLMVRGSLDPTRDFARVKATIHREVYGVEENEQMLY